MMRTSGAIRAVNQVSRGWRQHEVAGEPVSCRGDMFIKVQVTSLNHCISHLKDWSVASNTDLIIGVPPAKINH